MWELIHALAEPHLYAITFRNGELYVAEIVDLQRAGVRTR